LRRLGVSVWIAPESIRPGEGWVDAIERGLEESSHVVVVLTPAALQSRWVKKETNVAIALERKERIEVIPLDVEECEVPPLLGSYHMVYFRRDYDAGLRKLAERLGVRITPPEPVRPPVTMPEAVPPTVIERVKPVEPETVLIPAGEFLMGSDPSVDKDAMDSEQPQHTLYLPNYYLAKTPLTNTQYAAFMQATGHKQPRHWKGGKPPSGKEDHPVVYVSWHDAVAYCNWLSEVTGRPYRLPSEAEWEKGARGTDGRLWPWGNEWDAKRCNTGESGKLDTTPVGTYLSLRRVTPHTAGDTTPVGAYPQGASLYGLLDMAGNVWEWTRSVDKSYPYDPDDGRENLEAEGLRVLRGGAFRSSARGVRCAARNRNFPNYFFRYYGFRVVLVAPGFPLASGNSGL
jgi:formylglycine-generating enzyme required for sulfatase activity